jgi:hypothetical protein
MFLGEKNVRNWGGVNCNFQNMLLGTRSDFQNSNLNFIGKKMRPKGSIILWNWNQNQSKFVFKEMGMEVLHKKTRTANTGEFWCFTSS